MNKKISMGIAVLSLGLVSTAFTNTSHAYDNYKTRTNSMSRNANNNNFRRNGLEEEQRLVPQELRDQFRAEYEALSDEEKEVLRNQHREQRGKMKEALYNFTGLEAEEIRQLRREGESMGQILTDQGITQDQTRNFLTEQTNEKINFIAETRELTSEQIQLLKNRVGTFVDNMMTKWFN